MDEKFVLRNYPDDDALKNPEKYPKALAFSPDIIPLYGTEADHDALVRPSAWRGFTGMPIVGGDVNHVYIRGHGSGGPYIASLRAFPSELILWPQVWSNVPPVSSGPVAIPGGDTPGPYASTKPLWFRPPHSAGDAYSLVANVFKYDPANTHKDLHEYEPIPSFDPENFDTDDFLSYLCKNDGLTFYNVIVADPTSKHISAHTRLRMFGKSPVSLRFVLEWHNGSPAPNGLEASLVDNRGKIVIPRAPLSAFDEQKPITLEPLYDGVLTLNIFSPEESPFFEPYSGLSLKAFKVGKVDPTFSLAGIDLRLSLQPAAVNPPQLLGTLNIIFDPHSTRNIRFASPSARQLRESQNCPVDNRCQCPRNENCDVIPTTKPAATGWWFRGVTNDTNHFPRTSPFGYSPDIQVIGTDSDLTKPDLWSSLQNPDIDYSTKNSTELLGGVNNYIFLRGHSNLTDIDVQTRVFAVMGTVLIHPSQYTTQGLQGQLMGGDEKFSHQSISVEDSKEFYLINKPLDLKAPPDPNPGNVPGPSWGARPHYCLIAEARQKRKCSPVYPQWPSEQSEDYKTLQDLANWVASNPLVCSRNIAWEPFERKHGEKCFTWTCGTQLTFPNSSFLSSFWTIIIECDCPIIPPDCKWTLTCDDNEIFPSGLCFQDLPIGTQSPAYAGCHFTGATPGSAPKITLTITWCDPTYQIPPPSIKFKLALTEVNTLSPVVHLGQDPHPESENWPFYVGTKYPYIGLHANPSPLPTYASAGRQESWPYEYTPQFVVGQVAIAAKVV